MTGGKLSPLTSHFVLLYAMKKPDNEISVLVVEDNDDDAQLILMEIRSSGLKVDYGIAWDKNSFIDLLCNKPWDIIICDYHLIGITADDIISILNDYGSNIPVVVMSGSMTDEMEKNTKQSYVSKNKMSRVVPVIQRAMEQSKANEEMSQSWGIAVELKDKHTSGHSNRVADLSVDLARAIGLCEVYVTNIRLGAYLHDVGKIMIDDSILLKPGKLNHEEVEMMRRHPKYAYDFLRPLSFMRKAIEIPYCHHERWDGTGYPRGLKGEEIPVSARIFSIVDNWDAMTQDRPYRKALSAEFTLTFISQNAGKLFDPLIVNIFIEMMKGKLQ